MMEVMLLLVCLLYTSGQLGYYSLTPAGKIEFYLLGLFWMLLAIWRHRANIKRLIAGTENKLSFHKKEE